MKKGIAFAAAAAIFAVTAAERIDVAKFDPRMAAQYASVDSNGVKWIDGRYLPLEGRMFSDVDHYYDRLPRNVSTNINPGVRTMKHFTSGMLFRFVTDSSNLHFRWMPYSLIMSRPHMPSTGVSGIDVYRQDDDGRWLYVKTGIINDAKRGGSLSVKWKPGTSCIVNLPIYNGVESFTLGIDSNATVKALGPRKSGIEKPVVFYGTSVTHGGCCSRPGLSFVNIVGRYYDVPVVNLGFSGSGRLEFDMSRHLADIDASCYVIDCLFNIGGYRDLPDFADIKDRRGPICALKQRYEPFLRALRAARPGVPIIMADRCDVYTTKPDIKDEFSRSLYKKLIAEGWKDLYYLSKDDMYSGDLEGTVDGTHPNDLGMMTMAKAFGNAVANALKLKQGPCKIRTERAPR